jgi:hypothetical protein
MAGQTGCRADRLTAVDTLGLLQARDGRAMELAKARTITSGPTASRSATASPLRQVSLAHSFVGIRRMDARESSLDRCSAPIIGPERSLTMSTPDRYHCQRAQRTAPA